MRALTLLLISPLVAGEFTVSLDTFRIEHEFEATVVPTDPIGFTLQPQSWKSFVFETIAEHGRTVNQGDLLISFENEDYNLQLEQSTRALASAELELASKELEFAKLKEEVALNIAAAQEAKKIADETLDDFVKIDRPAKEQALDQDIKEAEFRLAAAREELKQLKQMYEADDLTEETEEIILDRQVFAVASAEFAAERVKRSVQHTRTRGLPRTHEQLKQAAAQAAITLEKAEKNLPRSIETAKLALDGTRSQVRQSKLNLERLKQDGQLLSWKAPADGIFFHGSFEEGKWQLGELKKSLKIGNTPPLQRVLCSFIPADSTPIFTAFVEPSTARHFTPGLPIAMTAGKQGGLALVGQIHAVGNHPTTDLAQPLTLSATWPDAIAPLWANSIQCSAVTVEKTEAITIPTKAIQLDADGRWTVEVKLADGKTENRIIERGLSNGKLTEVLSGLEPGQVVMTPDE
ncbi:MAG: hypothetical protein ACQKBU_09175 [Verrucomicrobiales bacterium]